MVKASLYVIEVILRCIFAFLLLMESMAVVFHKESPTTLNGFLGIGIVVLLLRPDGKD